MKTYKLKRLNKTQQKLCFYVVKIKEYEKHKTKNLRHERFRKHNGNFGFTT